MPPIIPGFECGYWDGHDRLVETRHTPITDMRRHYDDIAGIAPFVRDGFSPKYYPLNVVDYVTTPAIMDIVHFAYPKEEDIYFKNCLTALRIMGARGMVKGFLPVNEPSFTPVINPNVSKDEAIAFGIRAMNYMRYFNCQWPIYTCDPITGFGEEAFDATDRLVSTGKIDVVGFNYYPYNAVEDIGEVGAMIGKRYGLPYALTETIWHIGNQEGESNFPNITAQKQPKQAWMDYVRAKLPDARFVCAYPFIAESEYCNFEHEYAEYVGRNKQCAQLSGL